MQQSDKYVIHQRIVEDVICVNRCGQRAWSLRLEAQEGEDGGIALPHKNPPGPEVLRADVGAQVFPFRVLGIRRWTDWIGPDMAESAAHAHPIGPDEVLRLIEVAIFVEPSPVTPFFRRCL